MLVSLLKNLCNKFIFCFVSHLRSFFCKKKEGFWSALSALLGFYPKNKDIYYEASLHKSFCKKDEHGRSQNNERLEFLGDAILDTVVSDILYEKFPTSDEGFLTSTRSKIVQRNTLDKVAYQLKLENLISIASSAKIKNPKTHIMGNALEAFIGAIFLDKGYKKTKQFIDNCIIKPFIDIDLLVQKEVDFKSKILKWSQKNKVSLQFRSLEDFTDNNKNLIFQTQVLLNEFPICIGLGFSKKESQQHASQMSWRKIQKDKILQLRILSSDKKTITNFFTKTKPKG